MKRLPLFAALALAIGSTFSLPALAGHPYAHARHGSSVGIGLYLNPFTVGYSNYYRGYSPYAYAPRYVYQSSPEIFVTQSPQLIYVSPSEGSTVTRYDERVENSAYTADPSVVQGNILLYCHSPDGYYPAIKTCPSGWRKVPR